MVVEAGVVTCRGRRILAAGIVAVGVAATTACGPGTVTSAHNPPLTAIPAQHARIHIQLSTSAAAGNADVAEAAAAAAAGAGHRPKHSPVARLTAVVRHMTSALMMRAAGW